MEGYRFSYQSDMSREKLQALAQRCAQGDKEAREQLICAHLPLVEFFVVRYLGRGVDKEDLFQEGCYGLLRAVDRYDPNRGTALSTYAGYWIEKHIKNSLYRQNISIPIVPHETVYYKTKTYLETVTDLHNALGRQPTDEEICARMDLTLPELRRLQQYIITCVPLDEDGTHAIHENVKRPLPGTCALPSAEDLVMKGLSIADVIPPGANLTDRELDCLARHLGLGESGKKESFVTIAANTGWSVETLRKDYARAMEKLRAAYTADKNA